MCEPVWMKSGRNGMKKNGTAVYINLTALASYNGGTDDPIQFITTGTLTRPEKEHYVIRYRESQEDEETGKMMDSDIELDLHKNRVMMTRSGDFASTMVFSRDRRFEGKYKTPYGDMDMAVDTRQLTCALGDREGTMHLKYHLNIQGSYASTNELHLVYRTEGHSGEKNEKQ